MQTMAVIRGAEGDVWRLAADDGGLAVEHTNPACLPQQTSMPANAATLRRLADEAERWEQDQLRRSAVVIPFLGGRRTAQ